MIKATRLLYETLHLCDEETYKKFLANEVINKWDEIIDESISKYVKPVTIERGVLFVHVQNSAFKGQLKFFTEEIIDTINENFKEEEPLVKEVRIATGFQIANMPPEKKSPVKVEEPKLKLEDITLTDEEKKHCEEQAEKISTPQFREMLLDMLLAQVRLKKFRLANGWHTCAKCDKLCPPEEMFCEVCQIKERDAMLKALFKIFYDKPWLRPWEVQQVLLEQMPHMKQECSVGVIESARTSLIQRVASQVPFGDNKSLKALKLVALKRRLPPEKITPEIINKTLFEMRFDLAEAPRFSRYKKD